MREDLEIQAISLGDSLAFVGYPARIFHRVRPGDQGQVSVQAHAGGWVANGWVGYVPTEAASHMAATSAASPTQPPHSTGGFAYVPHRGWPAAHALGPVRGRQAMRHSRSGDGLRPTDGGLMMKADGVKEASYHGSISTSLSPNHSLPAKR